MNGRITSGMMQRTVLADLNAVSARLAKTQQKIASNREIARPSDDPFGASRAMALRQTLAATRQHLRNAQDAVGWQEATELALGEITDQVHRARNLLVQGATDSADPSARASIATELEQLIEAIKQNANATYAGSHIFSGTETATAPYSSGGDDTYAGDEAGWRAAAPGVLREIGPGVTLSINTVGREFLGDGPSGGDGKLLDVLRDAVVSLRNGDGAALRGTDLDRLDQNLDTLLEVRARNGARSNRLESAQSRLAEVEEATLRQLSETEDADIAKTLIEFNSQQAAYQSALRAGASLVQGSLMDFLR
ncbi:MAG: flagellar hook-associated protein FlgL [Solirubrobacteraceae bacterium]